MSRKSLVWHVNFSTKQEVDWWVTFSERVRKRHTSYTWRWKLLFRSLSTIICGSEDNCWFIRRILVTFCSHNKKLCQCYCQPTPIERHIGSMRLDRIWGTDLKIHAAASLWQAKIYVCQPNTTDSSYSWICFKPFPLLELMCPDECQLLPYPPGLLHFELFYAARWHYDVIISYRRWISSRISTNYDRTKGIIH